MEFADRHDRTIQAQSLHSLAKAFRQLVDMEVELESRLDTIREVKARIMIEIEIKVNEKK